jgi:light-regulated signal transduction histidine kinase (bacteriophytochrome)
MYQSIDLSGCGEVEKNLIGIMNHTFSIITTMEQRLPSSEWQNHERAIYLAAHDIRRCLEKIRIPSTPPQ